MKKKIAALLGRTACDFARARKAASTVEFAITSLALMAFVFGIINLGLLGLSLGMLQRAVEQTARKVAVTAANGTCITTTTSPSIQSVFNSFAAPVLSSSAVTLSYQQYSGGAAVPNTSSDPWVNNGTTGVPPGTYIALTAQYNWRPIGFAKFSGIPLKISTVAFAMGSPSC